MGKTYKALKESFDYGTIVGGAVANIFNKLASEQGGKKFRDVEDIINSLWAVVPSRIKRHPYLERGEGAYWQVWNRVENQYKDSGQMNMDERLVLTKRRVWAKLQILTDLFFNEDVWVKTKVVDVWDKEDYEVIYEEEVKAFGSANEDKDE